MPFFVWPSGIRPERMWCTPWRCETFAVAAFSHLPSVSGFGVVGYW